MKAKWKFRKPTHDNDTFASSSIGQCKIEIGMPGELPLKMKPQAHCFLALHIWIPVQHPSSITSNESKERIDESKKLCAVCEEELIRLLALTLEEIK